VYFTLGLGTRFASGGREFTFAEVADAIRGEPWAARNDHGDVIAGPDRDRVARSSRSEPRRGAEIAATLEP
jgi:hypothetical protein